MEPSQRTDPGGAPPPADLLMTPDASGPPFPEGIDRSLRAFRARMRREKLWEAAATCGLVGSVSFLTAAGIDRLFDSPSLLRAALLGLAIGGSAVVVPRVLARWVLRHGTVGSIAREVASRDPRTGDRLLGILELATDPEEFRRSPELVRAAIRRGERDLGGKTLAHALPLSRHRLLTRWLLIPLAAVLALFVRFPDVGLNALQRWALPFGAVERFTFTRVEGAQERWVLPIQEGWPVRLELAADTRSRPDGAELRLQRETIQGERIAGGYTLELPPLALEQSALLVIGDLRRRVQLCPLPRPEAVAANATVTLPAYLGLPEPLERNVSGGALSAVVGSEVQLTLDFSRDSRALGAAAEAVAMQLVGEPLACEVAGESVVQEVAWVDRFGLEGPRPFRFSVRPVVDAPPEVSMVGLEPDPVLLEQAALTFDVLAVDDLGVDRCGLEWFESVSEPGEEPRSLGEKVLLAQEPGLQRAEAFATLRPTDLGIEPGTVELRAWAVDLLPGRERAYSAPVRVRVMDEAQHLKWVSRQMDAWIEEAAEVRDRELELLATNETLLAMTDAELSTAEVQAMLEDQVVAERRNQSRLGALVAEGGELLDEAARNEAVETSDLEMWSEARDGLEELAEEDMEAVSKLLSSAAQAAATADTPGGREASSAGVVRAGGSGGAAPQEGEEAGADEAAAESPFDPTPNLLDVESSLAEGEQAPAATEPGPTEEQSGPGSIGLVGTTVPGASGGDEASKPEAEEPVKEESSRSMTAQQLAKAVEAQRALVESFNELALPFQEILARLEASTLVKRLKMASRAQAEGVERLSLPVARGFGSNGASKQRAVAVANEELAALEDLERQRLAALFTDLDAYADRLAYRGDDGAPRLLRVVAEWNRTRPVFLAGDISASAAGGRPGAAAMLAGYLSDRLDRWGDELVPPAEAPPEDQEEEGGTNDESLPPELILEVLRITEAEMVLRDVTREVEQARSALGEARHRERSLELYEEQDDLAERLDALMNQMRKLPDGSRTFGTEIRMMASSRRAMVDAAEWMLDGETGRDTLAAETEAIELLLQSRRAGGSGGGGKSSASPGGGNGGTKASAALALSGRATGERDQGEQRGMKRAARGEPSKIPVEFQESLERYFEALEAGR